MNVNKVFIYGNLTRDPEVRQLPNGTNVANIGVATNRYYNNQQGQKVEEVEYHNIVFFGRLADLAKQYLTRGSGVFVEGRLRTSNWDDKETGKKMYKTEIIGDHMQFGPRRGDAGAPPSQPADSSASSPAPAAPAAAPAAQGQGQKPDYPEATINPEDIPF